MPAGEIYVGFPNKDMVELGVGITIVDYIRGKAFLPNSSVIPLSRRINPEMPLRSAYFHVGNNVNVEVLYKETIQYAGMVTQGVFRIPNVVIDQIRVITTAVTEAFIVCSTNPYGVEGSVSKPSSIISGVNTTIGTTAVQLTETSTPIHNVVTVKVRNLNAAATYIALGSSSTQQFRLVRVGDSHDIDFVDNLNKVYVVADAGADNALEYLGG